jgi:MoaA/NifB/PqqE/SkfB family radical SAM enzyme
MGQIQIVNWLLTRMCNLSCEYCRISCTYEQPKEYFPITYYYTNQMKTEFVLGYLERFKKHNPNCFHIFYGGEPLLRVDLPEIIQFCHDHEIFYTVITNNSEAVQPRLSTLFEKVGHLEGLTSSIDPIIFDKNASGDIVQKSLAGLERLYKYRDKVKDLVAEITIDKNNIKYLYPLLEELTKRGICGSVTFIDIAKNNYYDFSNVTDKSILVSQADALVPLNEVLDAEFNIHMGESLLTKIYTILPSELDCEIERDVHNLTIDADGTVRLCLRIRGVETPKNTINDYVLDESGNLDPELISWIATDKEKYCEKCNHTCMIMSKSVRDEKVTESLLHTKQRKK